MHIALVRRGRVPAEEETYRYDAVSLARLEEDLRRSERARGGAAAALQRAWVMVVGGGLGAWFALGCLCRGRIWGPGRRRKKPSALID